MTGEPSTITVTHRTVVAFLAGVTLTIVTVLVFHGTRGSAGPGPDEATFVPVAPCRLADTRPNFNVGNRNTPIGPGETHKQQVTGATGNCTIPTHATGVSLNVTALQATAPSHMTIFPHGGVNPTVSNLNYGPGQPPVFNTVVTKLSNDGAIGVYNLAGTVHFIADVNGYYTHTGLQDLQNQVNQGRAFAVDVDAAGARVGPGPYTSEKGLLDGLYFFTFDFTSYQIPRTRGGSTVNPVVVATPRNCAGYTATSDRLGATGSPPPNNVHGKVIFRVVTYNAAGARADCGFHALINVEEPSPRLIGPLP